MRGWFIPQIGSGLLVVIAGLALGMLISKSTTESSTGAIENKPSARAKLSAISGQSPESRARKLIKEKAPPSKLWNALEACDSAALGRLSKSAKRDGNYTRAFLINARWIEIDPEAAASAASSEWDGLVDLAKVGGLWATTDPHAALDFMLASPGFNSNAFGFSSIITGARTIPDFNLKPLLEKLPAYQEGMKLGVELTEGDRIEKIRTIFLEPEKLSLSNEMATMWGLEEIVEAALGESPASELIELYKDPNASRLGELPTQLAAAYLQEDLEAALDWIFNQHTSFESAEISKDLVHEIREENPTAASKVIDYMPTGRARTEAMSKLATTWSMTDPAAYQGWHQQLDPQDRNAIDKKFEEDEQ